jgi:hypothetical protein
MGGCISKNTTKRLNTEGVNIKKNSQVSSSLLTGGHFIDQKVPSKLNVELVHADDEYKTDDEYKKQASPESQIHGYSQFMPLSVCQMTNIVNYKNDTTEAGCHDTNNEYLGQESPGRAMGVYQNKMISSFKTDPKNKINKELETIAWNDDDDDCYSDDGSYKSPLDNMNLFVEKEIPYKMIKLKRIEYLKVSDMVMHSPLTKKEA